MCCSKRSLVHYRTIAMCLDIYGLCYRIYVSESVYTRNIKATDNQFCGSDISISLPTSSTPSTTHNLDYNVETLYPTLFQSPFTDSNMHRQTHTHMHPSILFQKVKIYPHTLSTSNRRPSTTHTAITAAPPPPPSSRKLITFETYMKS